MRGQQVASYCHIIVSEEVGEGVLVLDGVQPCEIRAAEQAHDVAVHVRLATIHVEEIPSHVTPRLGVIASWAAAPHEQGLALVEGGEQCALLVVFRVTGCILRPCRAAVSGHLHGDEDVLIVLRAGEVDVHAVFCRLKGEVVLAVLLALEFVEGVGEGEHRGLAPGGAVVGEQRHLAGIDHEGAEARVGAGGAGEERHISVAGGVLCGGSGHAEELKALREGGEEGVQHVVMLGAGDGLGAVAVDGAVDEVAEVVIVCHFVSRLRG